MHEEVLNGLLVSTPAQMCVFHTKSVQVCIYSHMTDSESSHGSFYYSNFISQPWPYSCFISYQHQMPSPTWNIHPVSPLTLPTVTQTDGRYSHHFFSCNLSSFKFNITMLMLNYTSKKQFASYIKKQFASPLLLHQPPHCQGYLYVQVHTVSWHKYLTTNYGWFPVCHKQ